MVISAIAAAPDEGASDRLAALNEEVERLRCQQLGDSGGATATLSGADHCPIHCAPVVPIRLTQDGTRCRPTR